jgi:hypothetical protein
MLAVLDPYLRGNGIYVRYFRRLGKRRYLGIFGRVEFSRRGAEHAEREGNAKCKMVNAKCKSMRGGVFGVLTSNVAFARKCKELEARFLSRGAPFGMTIAWDMFPACHVLDSRLRGNDSSRFISRHFLPGHVRVSVIGVD